jgi:hypothetical protein
MQHLSKLLAWVEPQGDEEFVAAFVGGAAPQRAPAVQVCATPEEAREWIEHEAAEFGLHARVAVQISGSATPRSGTHIEGTWLAPGCPATIHRTASTAIRPVSPAAV